VGEGLSTRERRALEVQRAVGWLCAPLWLPLCAALVRWPFRWRVEGLPELRREYRRLRRASDRPLLVCANHLTMLDSAVVAHALGSAGFYLRDFGALPWNVPEQRNFASTWWKRALVWLMKCIPVVRGGDRRAVAATLERVIAVMQRGDVALVFPEGQRSRSGRVDAEASTYGVGRILKALPGCRVLCVYARGEKQESWSALPARDQRFRVSLACFEPKTDHAGLRGSLDLTRQVLARLAELERRHFDAGH
jgi:hypothetical protein